MQRNASVELLTHGCGLAEGALDFIQKRVAEEQEAQSLESKML